MLIQLDWLDWPISEVYKVSRDRRASIRSRAFCQNTRHVFATSRRKSGVCKKSCNLRYGQTDENRFLHTLLDVRKLKTAQWPNEQTLWLQDMLAHLKSHWKYPYLKFVIFTAPNFDPWISSPKSALICEKNYVATKHRKFPLGVLGILYSELDIFLRLGSAKMQSLHDPNF